MKSKMKIFSCALAAIMVLGAFWMAFAAADSLEELEALAQGDLIIGGGSAGTGHFDAIKLWWDYDSSTGIGDLWILLFSNPNTKTPEASFMGVDVDYNGGTPGEFIDSYVNGNDAYSLVKFEGVSLTGNERFKICSSIDGNGNCNTKGNNLGGNLADYFPQLRNIYYYSMDPLTDNMEGPYVKTKTHNELIEVEFDEYGKSLSQEADVSDIDIYNWDNFINGYRFLGWWPYDPEDVAIDVAAPSCSEVAEDPEADPETPCIIAPGDEITVVAEGLEGKDIEDVKLYAVWTYVGYRAIPQFTVWYWQCKDMEDEDCVQLGLPLEIKFENMNIPGDEPVPPLATGTISTNERMPIGYKLGGTNPNPIPSTIGNGEAINIYYVPQTFTITFVDWDGAELCSDELAYGATPTCDEPSRDNTAEFTYTFDGWNPTVETVKGEATYTATYTSETNKYTITFVDWDGAELCSDELAYGATPTCDEPSRDNTAEFTYTFAGWNPTVETVKGEATYTATYSSTVNEYNVTFVDWDDSVLKTESVKYGSGATAPADPSRAGYDFTGWAPAYDNITGDLTVKAQYDIITYNITYVLDGGTNGLGNPDSYTIESPAITLAPPTREGYIFTGWTPDEGVILAGSQGDKEFTATWTPEVVGYKVINCAPQNLQDKNNNNLKFSIVKEMYDGTEIPVGPQPYYTESVNAQQKGNKTFMYADYNVYVEWNDNNIVTVCKIVDEAPKPDTKSQDGNGGNNGNGNSGNNGNGNGNSGNNGNGNGNSGNGKGNGNQQ